MTLKRTELAKKLGEKISQKVNKSGIPERPGTTPVLDRREQRKLDQERGLVPFAVKISGELAKELRSIAESEQTDLNEVVETLLRAGLKSRI